MVTRLLLERGDIPDAEAQQRAERNITRRPPGSKVHARYQRTITRLKAAIESSETARSADGKAKIRALTPTTSQLDPGYVLTRLAQVMHG